MIDLVKKNSYLIVGVVTGVVFVSLSAQMIASTKLATVKNEIEEQAIIVENDLVALARQIAVGSRNEVALSIMPDCSLEERQLFDNNLSRLDKGLSAKELDDLDRVFNYCAPVYAIHRSVMTMQLAQTVANFRNLILQRKVLGKYEDMDADLLLWEQLLLEESKISKLSFDLVTLQKEIIEGLINGLNVDSEEASTLKGRGQAIQVELRASTKRTTELGQALFGT
jgi:hypothetical protein